MPECQGIHTALAGKRSKHMFISMEGVTVLVSGTQLSRQCMHDGVVPCKCICHDDKVVCFGNK